MLKEKWWNEKEWDKDRDAASGERNEKTKMRLTRQSGLSYPERDRETSRLSDFLKDNATHKSLQVCNSAVKWECCTFKETENNTDCRVSRGYVICSTLVLCMDGIHLVTADGSHPCTFPMKQPLNRLEPHRIPLIEWEQGMNWSIIVCFMCLSFSICLPSCWLLCQRRAFRWHIKHPLAPTLEVCSWQVDGDAISYLLCE